MPPNCGSPPMNVIFFIHTPRDALSAVYSHVDQRVRALQERGHSAIIVAPSDFSADGTRGTRSTLLWYAVEVAGALFRLRDKVDVAVFHSYVGWVFNIARCIVRSKTRSVTQFHGLEPLAYEAARGLAMRSGAPLSLRYRVFHGTVMPLLLRVSCRLSDLVVCLNERERVYLLRHRWAEPGYLEVVGNAIGAELLVAREYAQEGKVLVFVGQWLPNKGVRDLVEAFETLAVSNQELRLVCLGTRVAENEVRAAFATSVQAQVEVHPAVSVGEIAQQAAQADVFVLPSVSEGFSVALLEAMAAGLPIVTTPVGAAPDLLVHDQSAMFVPVGDSAALAVQLNDLLRDAGRRERLGRSAQQIAARFTTNAVVGHYCALLESVGAR